MMPNYCPHCGIKIIGQPDSCPGCDQPFDSDTKRLEARIANLEKQSMVGRNYEYKSRWGIFGWPLVHIAFGMDPETGKRRVARGLFAYGEMAIGAFAGGGMAIGGIAFGGAALGIISLGGVSFGLLMALGGLAISSGIALGGCAIGFIALGGGAIGYYCLGGGAFGLVAYGGNNRNPEALAFFQGWRDQAEFVYQSLRPTIGFLVLTPILLLPFLRRLDQAASETNPYSGEAEVLEKPSRPGSSIGLIILVLFGGVAGVCLIWLTIAILQLFVW